MNQEISVPFFLKTIQTLQFAMFEEYFDTNLPVELNTQAQFNVNPQNQIVGTSVGFTFEHPQKPFLTIKMSCQFKVKADAWDALLDPTKSNIVLPKHFLQQLVTLTIGTTRGALFAKTEGTLLNRFMIPTLDVTIFVQMDETFALQKAET
jgi:hypothetical protein